MKRISDITEASVRAAWLDAMMNHGYEFSLAEYVKCSQTLVATARSLISSGRSTALAMRLLPESWMTSDLALLKSGSVQLTLQNEADMQSLQTLAQALKQAGAKVKVHRIMMGPDGETIMKEITQ